MAKQIKISFKQLRVSSDFSEKQINEAFDVLFREVMKRLEAKHSDYQDSKNNYLANTI